VLVLPEWEPDDEIPCASALPWEEGKNEAWEEKTRARLGWCYRTRGGRGGCLDSWSSREWEAMDDGTDEDETRAARLDG